MADDERREWVLSRIRERTAPEPDGKQNGQSALWTSINWLKQDASGSDLLERDDVQPLVWELASRDRIIYWHGLMAPATDEHLRAIIENERQAGFTRKLLVGQCNQLLQAGREAEPGEEVSP